MCARLSRRRSGNVLVLTAFMMVGTVAVLAFAIDLGYLYVAKTELQRAADSAAMAAAWDLLDPAAIHQTETTVETDERARATAAQYAAYNAILTRQPALADDDVTVGYLNDPWDPNEAVNPNSGGYNAVTVRVQRSDYQNGAIPMLFGRVLGVDKTPLQAEATAVTYGSFSGFQASDDGKNLPLLPFTLDEPTYLEMIQGNGADEWAWNEATGNCFGGSDGICEVNLYPEANGSAGNRGTLDIGGANNSTSDIVRQILNGISGADLDYHGGKLELNEQGELLLNGDTGISAGFKDDLDAIEGQTRIIPIFRSVVNPGDNAEYTIVGFCGVRILYVKLSGSMSNKKLIIQPARVIVRGGIPSQTQTSSFVYSPVWLVR